MTPILPALNGNGWVTDPTILLNTLFAQCLVADYSQSTIYDGTITSIPYLVATYQDNPLVMATKLEEALTLYYSRYFVQVTVLVTYSDVPDILYPLYISIDVIVGGITYSLANVASIKNGMLNAVLQEINK